MRRETRPPSIDALARAVNKAPHLHSYAVKAARNAVAQGLAGDEAQAAASQAFDWQRLSSMCPLVNMSGVILHTGLGRARLHPEVAERLAQVAAGHAAVEFDLETGERGDRQNHVRWLLQELTGCDDALVVNNCAGAVFLALSGLAAGKEVVLSRGQMVEIGGAFRMPDIIVQSGCRLVEVGCTNRTHLRDYEAAMGENTGAILRCHQSNFSQQGFVCQVEPSELAKLAKTWSVPFVDDLGSGCLADSTRFGLPKERTLREALTDGADLVLASGDKLLGGPQAGLILGNKRQIQALKSHPLARALRVDKLTLAALEQTLRLYLEGREAELPIWLYCSRDLDAVKRDCSKLARAFPGKAVVAMSTTEVGGGSLPGAGIPTWRVGLVTSRADSLLAELRSSGIIGRIEDGKVWLDPRTAEAGEVKRTCAVLAGTTAWD